MPVLPKGNFGKLSMQPALCKVPMVISIWDDEFGISVPAKISIPKKISLPVLSGFSKRKKLPKDWKRFQKVKSLGI